MSINEIVKFYKKQILTYSTSEQVEEELLDKLDEIEDNLLFLEVRIENEAEEQEAWQLLSNELLSDEFNYTCREV